MKQCAFCHSSVQDEVNLGVLYTLGDITAHYFCIVCKYAFCCIKYSRSFQLLSSKINQSGGDSEGIHGFTLSDIKTELQRCKRLYCCYCKENMANLQCAAFGTRRCGRVFHLPCGLLQKTQHKFEGAYPSYCHQHSEKRCVPEHFLNMTEVFCHICCEAISFPCDIRDLYVPICCNMKTIFHLNCIKRMAHSAGYFTKCPHCNNRDKFLTDIKSQGVYIPMEDASWEQDPGAFSDLGQRHNQCDKEECFCPHALGRKYAPKSSRSKWRILLCGTCGSSGIHRSCNKGARTYTCGECTEILSKMASNSSEQSTSKAQCVFLEDNDRDTASSTSDTISFNSETTSTLSSEATTADFESMSGTTNSEPAIYDEGVSTLGEDPLATVEMEPESFLDNQPEEVVDFVHDEDNVVRFHKHVSFCELVECIPIPDRNDLDGYASNNDKFQMFLNDMYHDFATSIRKNYKIMDTKYV